MRDDLDDDVTYEFGDKTPSWVFHEDLTKAEMRVEAREHKKRQTILSKRKEFCDEIWRQSGPGTWLKKPDPAFTRRHLQIIRDANYADNCLTPKEFGFVLWAAKVLGVPRSRKILSGLVRLGPQTDHWFYYTLMGDFFFQQVCRYIPEEYVSWAKCCRFDQRLVPQHEIH